MKGKMNDEQDITIMETADNRIELKEHETIDMVDNTIDQNELIQFDNNQISNEENGVILPNNVSTNNNNNSNTTSTATACCTIHNLIGRIFLNENEMFTCLSTIFPKGLKMCRKDKWKTGPHQGLYKKWRFTCEFSGLPKPNENPKTTKKIGIHTV